MSLDFIIIITILFQFIFLDLFIIEIQNVIKILEWHSHNFLLPSITVEENFIISSAFIFNLCSFTLCNWMNESPAFRLSIIFSLISIFFFEYSLIWLILPIKDSIFQIKLWEIKQILETIILKFKIKIHLSVRATSF